MEIRIQVGLSLLAACALSAADQAAPVIKQFPLDERTVYKIGIGADVPTTLMFPSSLTAIEGANVTSNPDEPAPVLLAYTPGRHFFSVRAVEPDARAAVNVVWRNRTFVIRFAVSEEPYGSVSFYDDQRAAGPSRRERVSPEVLLSLLDRAKSFRLVQMQYPETVQQIEHAAPRQVTLYRDFRVTVEEVFRFDPEDTLVLRLTFENNGGEEVVYLPQRLAARVGHHVYYAAIADASGIIPPNGSTTGYFAITGTPRGGRANLSVRNRFNVVVSRVQRDAKLVVPE